MRLSVQCFFFVLRPCVHIECNSYEHYLVAALSSSSSSSIHHNMLWSAFYLCTHVSYHDRMCAYSVYRKRTRTNGNYWSVQQHADNLFMDIASECSRAARDANIDSNTMHTNCAFVFVLIHSGRNPVAGIRTAKGHRSHTNTNTLAMLTSKDVCGLLGVYVAINVNRSENYYLVISSRKIELACFCMEWQTGLETNVD